MPRERPSPRQTVLILASTVPAAALAFVGASSSVAAFLNLLPALPVIYGVTISMGGVAAYLLHIRARAVGSDRLRWVAWGYTLAVVSMCVHFWGMTGSLGEIPASHLMGDVAPGQFLIWHAVIPLFALLALVRWDDPHLARRVAILGALVAIGFTVWDRAPHVALSDEDGRYTDAFFAAAIAIVMLSAVATGYWIKHTTLRPTWVQLWIGVSLALSTMSVFFRLLAESRFQVEWWASLALQILQFGTLGGGLLVGVVALMRDAQQFAFVIDSSIDAVVRKDLDGKILAWNFAAERIYGYRADEVLGKHIYMLMDEEARVEAEELMARLRRGETIQNHETVRVRKDGRRIDVAVSMSPVKDLNGHTTGISTIARDVTEQKRSREALSAARAEAEDARLLAEEQQALAEIALSEAERARSEAERANRAKSDFLSRMSHELRTPLAAILGFGQLLEMDEEDPENLESISYIRRSGKHLLSLIDEILDISKIESGHIALSLEPVSVSEVVADVVAMVDGMASARGIAIRTPGLDRGTHVMVDAQRLRQTLLNLISNAVKYNREEGDVLIDHSVHDGRVRITVSDEGPGIAPENTELVFEPFERLEAADAGVEGTGLGLALTKTLVGAMGGAIGIESGSGHGVTFWVEFDQVGAPYAAQAFPPEPVRSSSTSEGGRVLLIEDNVSNVKLIQALLSRLSGVDLQSTMHGSVGLDLIRNDRPDLVLLDLHLPDMSGIDVLRRLKADERTADIPVVVTSADAIENRIGEVLELGADEYLTKPLDMPRFMEVVGRYLENKVENPTFIR